jgi:hypothetical protein
MFTLTKTRSPVKPLTPVSGGARVLRPVGTVNDAVGEISINDHAYYLTRLQDGYRLTGFDARRQQVTTYDLPLDLSTCDCPDGAFRSERPGGCKHRKALTALKAAGKI